ncbi:ABC transporter permease [Niameybacter massiliensis]|uniref:ABC transporter permease n=1 Tax=Holtiella tumoricola TaxID=3018743 RepID=A0AA42J2C6_9FIRM|nr:ABC transporter permease [Holtiella tumoricola]MDA3732961.1 ABC transporter permease [Holtiella tumoricola]
MIKCTKHVLIYISILAVTLFAWGICLVNAQKIQALDHVVQLHYEKEGLTGDQLESVLKDQLESKDRIISGLVAWNQETQQTMKNQDLGRGIEGNQLKVYGNTRLLFETKELIGNGLYENDLEGAIITEQVAYELWGNTDVVGKQITLQDKDYTIRGILKDKSKSIIVQSDTTNQEAKFNVARIEFIDNDNVEETLNTLQFKYNLPKGIYNNLSLKSILLSYLALIPGCLLGVYGMLKLYFYIYRTHRYWISAIVLSIIAIGITWVTGEVLQLSIQLPSYIIPNRWSDFAFWSILLEKFRANEQMLKMLPTSIADGWYQEVYVVLMSSFIVSLLGCIMIIKKAVFEETSEYFGCILMSIIISFISIISIYIIEGSVLIIPAFWCSIPLLLGIHALINKWRTILEE